MATSISEQRYKKLYSMKNLELAWDRILTSKEDLVYKNYYRKIFTYFDYDLKSHLQVISTKLKNNSYKPSKPIKLYKPKASGLQRPFTLLSLEDLVVYQAIANVFAPTLDKKRKSLKNDFVFSHKLQDPVESNIFLVRDWKYGYRAYKRRIEKNFKLGLKFTAHFDLASYYDTIDHNSLLSDYCLEDDKTRNLLCDCLKSWANYTESSRKEVHHGIPQGPLASCVFGELYLVPIDEFLQSEDITYSRYVDDIVIQSDSLEKVQRAVAALEIKCKERGLIPQAGKFEIKEAKSVDEALGCAPSLAASEKELIFDKDADVVRLIEQCFAKESYNSSKIRYILKSYRGSNQLLPVVFREFRNHYEFTEEFCVAMEACVETDSAQIESFICGELERGIPYDFVTSELWKTFRLVKSFSTSNLWGEKAVVACRNSSAVVKLGAYSFLSSLKDNRFVGFASNEKDPILLALLIPYITPEIVKKANFRDLLNNYLERKDFVLSRILERHLFFLQIFGEISKTLFNSNSKYFPKFEENKYETIQFYLKEDFDINEEIDWRSFFAKAYDAAQKLLYGAHGMKKRNPSFWLNCIDSFNDILIQVFIDLKTTEGKIRTKKRMLYECDSFKFWEYIKNGSLIGEKYPNAAEGLRVIHDRRCGSLLSHPRNKKKRMYSTFVESKEIPSLRRREISALKEIVKAIKELDW